MTDTDVMYLIAAAALLVVAVMVFLMKGGKAKAVQEPAFEKKKYLLLPGEHSFLSILEKALPEGYRVFGNVPLGDLVKPTKGLAGQKRQTALKQVDEMRVAFAVCSAADLALVGVVELDGRLQGGEGPRHRELLEQALADARIPVVTFSSEEAFELPELKKRLADSLNLLPKDSVAQDLNEIATEGVENEAAPLCPKCTTVMVKRLAMRGRHMGKFFWACSAYPNCRHVEPVQVNPTYAAIADIVHEEIPPSVSVQ